MSRSTEFQRSLDRYLGDAIALILSVRRPRAKSIENPTRIGIIQPSAIGDVIMASGLIAHARATYPLAEFHLLHGSSNQAALELLEPGIHGHEVDFTKPVAALQYVRSLKLDILLDLVPWSSITALVCRLSGARLTLGFAAPGRLRHFLFGRAAAHSHDVHQSENFRALASFFGPLEHYTYKLREEFPEPKLKLPYDRLIICHIRAGGSQARAKSWPDDRWVDLAGRLCDAGYAVGFSGSPADRPAVEVVMARVERPGRECLSLVGSMSLLEFCFVLQHARLLVSVDTSPVHLASALNAPVVGIHGPTLSRRWGANTSNSCNVDAVHPAAGFIQYGYESHPLAREVMRAVSVDEVYAAASTLLERRADRTGIRREDG
jgi:ADP-heptose:LPS heptosyltransferase